MSDLHDLLADFDLDDQFMVIKADAGLLKCRDCHELVEVDGLDTHGCLEKYEYCPFCGLELSEPVAFEPGRVCPAGSQPGHPPRRRDAPR